MPKGNSYKAPGKIALDKESLSSASQLAHFGVRTAKFTHRFSADGGTTFSPGYSLPAGSIVVAVGMNVSEVYATATTATVKAGVDDISGAMAVATAEAVPGTPAQGVGDLTVEFDSPPTAGEATFAVAYLDLSELS